MVWLHIILSFRPLFAFPLLSFCNRHLVTSSKKVVCTLKASDKVKLVLLLLAVALCHQHLPRCKLPIYILVQLYMAALSNLGARITVWSWINVWGRHKRIGVIEITMSKFLQNCLLFFQNAICTYFAMVKIIFYHESLGLS